MKLSRQSQWLSLRRQSAFSMIEMLFVGSMALVILGAASLIYGALANRVAPPSTLPTLSDTAASRITNNIHVGLYGVDLPTTGFKTWTAPNIGLQARADEARDLFFKDIESANAVFCFARNSPVGVSGAIDSNQNRRLSYTFPLAGRGANGTPLNAITGLVSDFTRIDNPQGFYALLTNSAVLDNSGGAAARASTYLAPVSGGLQVKGPNASIFIVGPTPGILSDVDNNVNSPNAATQTIRILAIWEIDFIDLTTDEGVFASVRRYSNSLLDTNDKVTVFAKGIPTIEYTTIFSERNSYGLDLNQNSFGPIFKAYMRTTSDQLDTAAGQPTLPTIRNPFYVIWWPDPASPNLVSSKNDPSAGDYRFVSNASGSAVTSANTIPATRVLSAESQAHYGNTSYLMIAPMFPSLLQ
jgi:hypothetical protein